ncbi:hypothetical protein [Streptantibioticus ferralitis]|uniref:CPBP family intramembrane metalloprotease n=1 Tax=Streptantibioticus ferralitis TaxID=236510 RepID=A0ABT5Z7I6_9ACTN|nr:hypothetical protein [Streptantibioticus ferralitis]MDF2259693.1 hypothetical protein [Streptantibioticus ferralitis]
MSHELETGLALAFCAAMTLFMLSWVEQPAAYGMMHWPARRLLAATCAVFCLADLPNFVLGALWNVAQDHSASLASHSSGSQHSVLWADLLSSAFAGFGEEVVVIVFPALLAWRIARYVANPRLRRACLTILVIAMVGARLSYHIYYGLSALTLVPWALICVLIYVRTRAAIPLMLSHTLYDAMLAVDNRVGARYGYTAYITLGALVFVAAAALLIGLGKRGRSGSHQREAEHPHSTPVEVERNPATLTAGATEVRTNR